MTLIALQDEGVEEPDAIERSEEAEEAEDATPNPFKANGQAPQQYLCTYQPEP